MFFSGDDLGVFVVRTIKARIEQRTMPSTTWMMPSPTHWGHDENLVETPDRNYTVYDYEQLFKDMHFPTGWMMRQDTENLTREIRAPGVEVHCLHGSKLRTPGKFTYGKGKFPDYQPNVVWDDGDGTVNIRSLLACLKWRKEQKQKVYHKVFEGGEHMNLLSTKEVIDYLDALVT